MWTVGDRGASVFALSHLDLTCRTPARDGDGTTCTAFDGTRTGLFAVNTVSPRLAALASVEGHFYLSNDAGSGWLMGWWEGEPVLIRAATREAIRVAPRNGESLYELAISGNVLGAVTSNEGASTVRLYSLK